MQFILLSSLLILLSIIVYQDVKDRAVSWILFPLAAVLIVAYYHYLFSLIDLVLHFLINLLVVGILLVCLTGYVYLRFKDKGTNLWNHFGLGDVLFFLVLACSFSPFNFIFFTILSLIFAILVSLFQSSKMKTVPLAGYQALCLMLLLIVQRIFSLNPFNDYWIYQWI